MTFLDPRLWGALLLAAAIGVGGGYWKGHHDADQSATVENQAKQIKDLKADRDTYRQRSENQAKVIDDAKIQRATAEAAARRADASAVGLRAQVRKLLADARSGDSHAIGGSSTEPDAIGVLADVLGRIDDRAGILAKVADTAHREGLACERSYDALTAK